METIGHNGNCCGVKTLYTDGTPIVLTESRLQLIKDIPTRGAPGAAWIFKAELSPKSVEPLMGLLEAYPLSKLVRLKNWYWFTLESQLSPPSFPASGLCTIALLYAHTGSIKTFFGMRHIESEEEKRQYLNITFHNFDGTEDAEIIVIDRQQEKMDGHLTENGFHQVMSSKNPNSHNRINLYLRGDYEMLLDCDR
jgi:hypothetical protein